MTDPTVATPSAARSRHARLPKATRGSTSSALCEGPRAASDYIEIATEYHTVLLGGIASFTGGHDDPARRFITLVDELYDRHVNLVCTAAAAPPLLYTGAKLAGAFARTASRLIEMQSAEYLALAHRG